MARATAAGLAAGAALAAGCARRPGVRGAAPDDPVRTGAHAGAAARGEQAPTDYRPFAPTPDLAATYRRMGLVVAGGDVPFAGRVAYLAGHTPDSTLALVTLSFTNRAFTFVRDGDRYRAGYQVRFEVRRAPPAGAGPAGGAPGVATAPVLRVAVSDQLVRLAAFRETARTDESVLFSEAIPLAPGRYVVTMTARDAESGRATAADVTLTVPQLGAAVARGGLSTPVVAYEAEPRPRTDVRPRVLAAPRAAAVFGQDSAFSVYLEAYAAPATPAAPAVPVTVLVRGERGVVLWRDTVWLARPAPAGMPAAPAIAAPAPDVAPYAGLYAGVVRVPVAHAGVGVLTFQAVRRDRPADTAATALHVSLGDELPAASFDEMLGYLRYYAAPARLRALRAATPEARPARWAAFLRETDATPPAHGRQRLREHLARLRDAARRFGEDGVAGWLTDRGFAYAVLGEPDQISDPNVPEQAQRGRTQVWEYRDPRLQLVFVDQNGFGRWRLTPAGAAAVQTVMRRRWDGGVPR